MLTIGAFLLCEDPPDENVSKTTTKVGSLEPIDLMDNVCIYVLFVLKTINYKTRNTKQNKSIKLYRNAFFRPLTGVSEEVFDYIHDIIGERLYESRNVRFENDTILNEFRRPRGCKISNQNRIICL